MKLVLLSLLRSYQTFLSLDRGWLGKLIPHQQRTCRFEPSCSEYAWQAIDRFGAVKGSFLAVKRIARCHPWGGHGYDPVPER
jgi:putative membrane protein insertion efficiency factor